MNPTLPEPASAVPLERPDAAELPAALRRRQPGAALQPFDQDYLALKAQVLLALVNKVVAQGQFRHDDLLDPRLATLDERVVEYPMVARAIAQAPRKGRLQLLDVGCVLNNAAIEPALRPHCDMLWLMNASVETLQHSLPTAYLLGDARSFPQPPNLQFDLVTCLSTLEHFGMDNTRYGGQPAEFEGTIDDPERYACMGLERILRWVRPGGEILVSVPYGPFEFLHVDGQPGKPIYYTFDAPRLQRLADVMQAQGITPTVSCYKVRRGVGWLPCGLQDTDIPRHADGCAAAGGVAFLFGRKPDAGSGKPLPQTHPKASSLP